MPLSKTEFAKIYNQNRFSLTGTIASEVEIEENYRDYQALVELTGRSGEVVHFSRIGPDTITWDFSPTQIPA